MVAEPRPVPLTEKDLKIVDNLTGWNVGIGIGALTLGLFLGVLQGLEHAGFDFYSYLEPVIKSYYQGLSIHGVLNALVWTTFFICGFFTFSTVRSLNRPLRYPWINRLALILMVIGLALAAYPLLSNMATVLYTFYPPLMAHWLYYLGLTLVVVGSWTVGYGLYFTYGAWRKENPGVRTPFIALAAIITMVLWQLCTLGVAAEILLMLLPLSLGWIDGVDPLLGRTLFWFFGHPLVYFWLLPAYVSWYAMLPAQTNGKMFSESLARLVFWLFLLFSTPVGFHHQYTDPGIPVGWKFLHTLLTYGVGFPSMLTAFTVVASLELGARARGGKGWFRWMFSLNWGDASYTAQNLAMILFVFGGIGGIINASYNLNLAVHNTTWIPGHFHLTVGSATTLTFFGICYWLIPKLTGRKLLSNGLALAQAWTWFFGMLFMSNAYHTLGLLFSAPRRTMLGAAPYASEAWNPMLMESLFGVLLLCVSATLFFLVIFGTALNPRKLDKPIEMPVAEPLDPTPTPAWLDTWTPWMAGAIALILLSYGPMIYQLVRDAQMIIPGMQPWPR
ncbi:MAG: cbb3-type cytochrome c oxidase subunit I [Caldilineaceae bacterium]|nr:cbb3-type cytochrome c oxidase subunit I [Caldilineaceae bacterium]